MPESSVSTSATEVARTTERKPARVLSVIPEVATKLESGELNLTKLAKAQVMMRAQEKATGNRTTREAKRAIIKQLENKPCKEADKELFKLMPEAASTIHQDRRTQINKNSRQAMNLTQEATADLAV